MHGAPRPEWPGYRSGVHEVGVVVPSTNAIRFARVSARSAAVLTMLGVLAAFAVTITLIATRSGPLLSPDSVTYVSLARNLASGRGYVDLTGQPNTTFAPGLPAILAAASSLGVSIATASRAVNAASFVALVALGYCLLVRHTRSLVLSFLATAFILASPAMLDVTDHLWSEMLFSALVLVFVLALEEAARRSREEGDLRWELTAGAIAGLACLVRYAGFPLVLVGFVCTAATPGTPRTRVRRSAAFLATAVPLPLLWTARNAASGARYLLGPRTPSPLGVARILDQFVHSSSDMFVRGLTAQRAWWALAIAALAIGLAVSAWFQQRAAGRSDDRPSPLPLVAFVVVYSVAVIVSGKTAGSSVDTRIVMPILVPIVVLVARQVSAIGTAIQRGSRAWVRPVFAALACVAVVALVVDGDRTVRDAWNTGRAPRGYATDTLAVSPLARAVEARVGADETVTTNSPWTLYSATGHVPIVPMPGPLYPSASLVPLTSAELATEACRHPAYFALYTTRGKQVAPELVTHFGLRAVAVEADGVLYRMIPRKGPCVAGPNGAP